MEYILQRTFPGMLLFIFLMGAQEHARRPLPQMYHTKNLRFIKWGSLAALHFLATQQYLLLLKAKIAHQDPLITEFFQASIHHLPISIMA